MPFCSLFWLRFTEPGRVTIGNLHLAVFCIVLTSTCNRLTDYCFIPLPERMFCWFYHISYIRFILRLKLLQCRFELVSKKDEEATKAVRSHFEARSNLQYVW